MPTDVSSQPTGHSDDAGSLRQLRHDLLNPINVLMGATAGLRGGELSGPQVAWVRLLESAVARLIGIVATIARDERSQSAEGRARFADLCSIAAARVGKPFDRQRLVDAIREVGGDHELRILLVDDSPEIVMLVRAYLADTLWTLDDVENGERAVARAAAERYDVVLMDIDLPGLDGTSAAHAIRAAELAGGETPTPIIAMTAFDPDPLPSRGKGDSPLPR